MAVRIGREREYARLIAFLASVEAGPAAMVVDGDPGIGKTTLWREVVAEARERGMTVLTCRAVEAEAPLAFVGLIDLLTDVADEALMTLPPPQRQALEVALLRGDEEDLAVDPRAVAAAVATTVRQLAERGPVLLAVDDAPWLDTSTARVLSYAVRRIEGQRVGLLISRRTSSAGELPLGLDTALTDGRVGLLRLGPLNLREMHHLLSRDLGRPVPRPLLVRVEQASGGNPLFALELVRALDRSGGEPRPGEPLTVPSRLRDLLADRMVALAPEDRSVLLLAAASATPTEALLRGRPGGAAAVDRAEASGLIELDDGRVRFTHPMLASTLYGSATTAQRRAAHRLLAEVAGDAEHEARHLALSVVEADAGVADALEHAAVAAARRGAAAAATELYELAVRCTPEIRAEDAVRRQLAHARHLFRDGDSSGAATLVRQVHDRTTSTAMLGEATLLEAEIEHEAGNARAVKLCQRALRLVACDDRLVARVHAVAACVEYDDFEAASAHAREALLILERQPEPDPRTASMALNALIGSELVLGKGFDRGAAERALELERLAPPFRVAERVSASLGPWLACIDELDEARAAVEATHQTVVDEGDDSSLPYALGHWAKLEWTVGHWDRARSLAAEQLDLADATGQVAQRGAALYLLGLADSARGDVERARAAIEESLRLASDPWEERRGEWVTGFLELGLADFAAARPHFERARELGQRMKLREPGVCQETLDLAETLVGLGELSRAAELVAEYDSAAARLDRPSCRAAARRTGALVLSAQGDHAAAATAVAEAMEQHKRVRLPFEVGRTYLAHGRIERRQRHKKAAQKALLEAVELFDGLGATPWSVRARAELARIGLRHGAPDRLTETELRVADLVAAGMTNREVAEKLYISPKTVEANLSRIYPKLSIRSRAELGRALDAYRHGSD